ncbi:SPFH domain-containing protein [Acetobacter sp.]|uniref:SPFH domain-containing protein n=1 Tax=Acetobacter sp. TaxID=440 RepID=UPI0039E8A882
MSAPSLSHETDLPSKISLPPVSSPLEQTVKLAFLLLAGVTVILGVIWATGNIRAVPTDGSAVVIRYGKVIAERHSGLVIALPRPFEEVRFLPSPDHQLSLRVTRDNTAYASDETDLQLQESDDFFHMEKNRDAANSSYLLTGDNSVVRLDATLSYRVLRPVAYMQALPHIQPMLRRLFYAAATTIAASHPIEDFLVVHADSAEEDDTLSARRAAVRSQLMQAVNQRLERLHQPDSDTGIEVTRIDLVAILPPRAKQAFDQVLTAEQAAAQSVASAQTTAERTMQDANAERDRIRSAATASAEEFVRQASSATASILAEEEAVATASPDEKEAAALRAWRERMGLFLAKAGEITIIPPGDSSTLLSVPARMAPPSSGDEQ